MIGFFDNHTAQSAKCPSECSICGSFAYCIACNTGYFLSQNNTCEAACASRFFQDSMSMTCVPCPYDCLQCDKTGACLQCDSVHDFRALSNSTSRCVPLSGYFDNLVAVCGLCPVNCSSCLSTANCTLCDTGFFLYLDALCYNPCPTRSYPDTLSQTCQRCYFDCLTCSSYDTCLTCSPSTDFRTLNGTSSRCPCLDGYY